jgi:hypothetical protein
MDDLTREQFNIFLSHINKGVVMETNETTTIKVPELTTGQKTCAWLKTARVALHARMQLFENYEKDAASGRYIALTFTALERSRMFMGKLMGAYGNINPYPDGYKPENTKVENIADTYTGALPVIISGQEIVFIKQQRVDCKNMIEGLETFLGHFPFNTKGNMFLIEATVSLHDATNWLGMELWSLNQKTDSILDKVKEYVLPKTQDVTEKKELSIDDILNGEGEEKVK